MIFSGLLHAHVSNLSHFNVMIFSGFLQAHVSYLDSDCEVCLLLLSVDRDSFFKLSEAKDKIKAVSFYVNILYMYRSLFVYLSLLVCHIYLCLTAAHVCEHV